jgi:hypothetical protein
VAQNFPLPVSHPTAIPVSKKKKKSYTATVMATSLPHATVAAATSPAQRKGKISMLSTSLIIITTHFYSQLKPM